MLFRYIKPAAAAVGAVVLTACSGASGGAGAPPAFPPTTVQIEAAKASPIADATEYVATLTSLRSTTIHPQIDGQITQIFVKSGDRVAQGDRLMQIDAERQRAAVSSQEAERTSREADVSFARQRHQRASELFKAGAISQQELEQAQTALETAEAGLKALSAQVEQQQVQLRYYAVTAPTAGVVGDVPVRVGSQVSPQTLLTSIDQNQTLEVYVQVPIERSNALKAGLPIQILSSDGAETLGTATVGFIAPSVDPETQSILVKGTVQNPDGRLRAAQFVRARIVWKTGEGLVVPVTSVLRVNGQFFAFVAEDSKGPDGQPALVAKMRPITVGPIEGNAYQVLTGLKAGDRLVVSGAQKLGDGAPIVPAQ
jgi:RND family efflux transporter MFP subunit